MSQKRQFGPLDAFFTKKVKQDDSSANAPPQKSSSIVRVFPDGSCFFRCLSVSLDKTLQSAERSSDGLICDYKLRCLEQSFADDIRDGVVRLLRCHVQELDAKCQALPMLLERDVGKYYKSMSHRLESMTQRTEFAGNLEVLAAAYLMKRQIHIVEETINTVRLIAKFPETYFCDSSPIKVIHKYDTASNPGHFDLLLGCEDGPERKSRKEFNQLAETCIQGENNQLERSQFMSVMDSLHLKHKDQDPSASVDLPVTQPASRESQAVSEVEPDDAFQPQNCSSKIGARGAEDRDNQDAEDRPSFFHPTLSEKPKVPLAKKFGIKKPEVTYRHQSDPDIVAKRKSVYPWLTAVKGGALCAVCSEFYATRPLPTNHTGTFVTKPFNNWKRSTGSEPKDNKLLKHHQSASHLTACAFESDSEKMSAKQRTVYSMIHKQSLEQQQKQLERLADFADVAYYLFKQEIAHTTHYESLMNLVGRLDRSNEIKQFMDSSPDNATYTSTTTVTELLKAVSDWLTSSILDELRLSQYIAVLADESTDLRTRNELSICFRYVINGESVERYLHLQQLQSTDAETVKDAIRDLIVTNGIPVDRIYWMAFDGAANMAGKTNGVQAKLKRELLPNANYVHCRSHLLNLAAANVARDMKPLRALFSSFNSLWTFFHNSPKRHNVLVQVQQILKDPALELVRAGDTRWTSNYRAVHTVKLCLRSIVAALQEVHCSSGDLSSEAGGLLLTFQDPTSVLLIHALDEILLPLHILTLQLQSSKMSLADLPEKVELAITRLHEIRSDCESYASKFKESIAGAAMVGDAANIPVSHRTVVQPYIDRLCKNIEKRFGDSISHISTAALLFNPRIVDEIEPAQQRQNIQTLAGFFNMNADSLLNEWVCFGKYLARHRDDDAKKIFTDLFVTPLGEGYPELCKLAGIVLACPVGTAGVERSFSTMNRLCTRMRQRLTSDHLHQLLLISMEGPDVLSRKQLEEIVRLWAVQKPRRIQLPPAEELQLKK